MDVDDFSILHISDLHKGGNCNYEQLLDSLITDKESYQHEGIPPVMFIVVSGDLIRGSKNNDLDCANHEIEKQYYEVEGFLNELVDNFIAGDKNRIIIVPGNHDINWSVSKNSMISVTNDNIKDPKEAYLYTPQKIDNPYRWDWENLQFLKINDNTLYEARLDKFVEFFDRFYCNEHRKFPSDREKEALYIEFKDFNIAFACFNSNCRLDHLNPMGLIHNSAIHSVFTNLRNAHNSGLLTFGVWHHHIYGYPYTNNYLDRNIVRSLGTNHIKVGLFGHQHRCEVVEELKDLTSDENDKMLLLSSGTLFGDKENMVPGIKRQYNIISVKMLNGEAVLTLRFREDTRNDYTYPQWRSVRLLNGNTYVKYHIKLEEISIEDRLREIDKEITATSDFKKGFITMREYENNPISKKFSDKYIQNLSATDDADFIIENIKEPETEIEYGYLLEAYVAKGNKAAIKHLLENPQYKNSDNVFVIEVTRNARRQINKRSWKKLE